MYAVFGILSTLYFAVHGPFHRGTEAVFILSPKSPESIDKQTAEILLAISWSSSEK